MLRRNRQIRIQIFQIIDAGIFALALGLGWLVRYDWKGIPIPGFEKADQITGFAAEYAWMIVVILPLTPIILDWQGYYERPIYSARRLVFWQLAKACLISTVGLILVQFMLRREGARGVIVLFGLFALGLMLLKEEVFRWAYRSKFGQSQFKRRVILVGVEQDTGQLRTAIAGGMQELEIIGVFDLNQCTIEDLVSFLHEHSINMVIIHASHTVFGQVERAINACELEGIETWLLADFFKTQISRTSLDDFYGRPILVFHSGPEMPWPRLAKQLVDLVGALILLAVFAIPMLLAAIAIKLTSKGPILFRQQRSGLNGRPFVMYKFRTMVTNAEQLKHELAALNEMSGPVFKVTNDPRVTPIGRFLRKSSLDECPQLFNVLRFEMSLVGPRPLPVDEVKRFDDMAHRRRLSVQPGLTCTWQ